MKKIFTLFAMATLAFTALSCDMYDDGLPSKAVRDEFNAMYPDAKDVEWEREGLNWSVSFETGIRPNLTEHEAWFDTNGNWIRTETDLYVNQVPDQIKTILESSEYASSFLEDNEVNLVSTPDGDFYRFELWVSGAKVKVDVYENGTVKLAGLGF